MCIRDRHKDVPAGNVKYEIGYSIVLDLNGHSIDGSKYATVSVLSLIHISGSARPPPQDTFRRRSNRLGKRTASSGISMTPEWRAAANFFAPRIDWGVV